MKSLRVFLAVIVILIGAMVIAVPPVLAPDSQRFQIMFDPYFVGSRQQDWLIVENFSRQDLNLFVQAIDPFTGEVLDEERVTGIASGAGIKMAFTMTMPLPHASRLLVEGSFDANGSSAAIEGLDNDLNGELPVRVTKLLLDRAFNTVLQVSGIPIPMIDG